MNKRTHPENERASRLALEAYLALRAVIDEELAGVELDPDLGWPPAHYSATSGTYTSGDLKVLIGRQIGDRYLTCYLEVSSHSGGQRPHTRFAASLNVRRGAPGTVYEGLMSPALSVIHEGVFTPGGEPPLGTSRWLVRLQTHEAYPAASPSRVRQAVERLSPPPGERLLEALRGLESSDRPNHQIEVSGEDALCVARFAVRTLRDGA